MNLNNKKILITSCNGLGDLIMFTPALRRIKEKFPTCHVTFLCRDNHREVLEGLPYVDKVVCIYRGKVFGRYRAIPALINCDAIIFTDWHPVMIIFAKLFNISIRADEIFGLRLLTLHNLRYLQRFMADMRESILADRFNEFREEFYSFGS